MTRVNAEASLGELKPRQVLEHVGPRHDLEESETLLRHHLPGDVSAWGGGTV